MNDTLAANPEWTEAQRCGYATTLWLVQQGYMDEAHMELAAKGIEANFSRAIGAEREACAKEIDTLRLQKAGLEAMLCDAQKEIADLHTEIAELLDALKIAEHETELEASAGRDLRAELGKERASHCVCKCDNDGDFVSQCLVHQAVQDERDQLRALLNFHPVHT